jgi:hypothetical protein
MRVCEFKKGKCKEEATWIYRGLHKTLYLCDKHAEWWRHRLGIASKNRIQKLSTDFAGVK